jgi:hypothetical protein
MKSTRRLREKDHSSVADMCNNMACLSESQGKFEDGMKWYGKALEIKKETLGEDHSDVTDTTDVLE